MQKVSEIIAQAPYFFLFQKFTNVQFIIELFGFLIATISLLLINSILEKVIPQIMPSLI